VETTATDVLPEGRVKTSLKDCGPFLPIGISGAKDIVVRPWRMKEERDLGALKERFKDANIAQYIGMVLGTMCTRLGPHDFSAMDLKAKRLVINQMPMGDVFYAYIWLRKEALGSVLKTKIQCPRCSHMFEMDADLDTIEVICGASEVPFAWTHTLRHPVTIRGQEAQRFVMGVPLWDSLESLGVNGLNRGAGKAAVIASAIKSVGDQAVKLGSMDLDELSKADIEELSRGVEDNRAGPDMSMEGECPRCYSEYHSAIDWGFDGFFAVSSR
jgi:hypothetical protein